MEDAKVKFCEKEYDVDSGVASFTFGNGEALELNVEELPADTQKTLMLHGLIQKVGDSFAGAKGDFAAALEAAARVIEQLKEGKWTAGKGAGGEAKPRVTELAEAIARLKGIPVAQAIELVAAADDEKRKTLRGNARVKAAIAQIRAEKAQAALEKSTDEDLVL